MRTTRRGRPPSPGTVAGCTRPSTATASTAGLPENPCARTRSSSRSGACTWSRGCPSDAPGAVRSTCCTVSWPARGCGSSTCATSRSVAGRGTRVNLRAHFWSETAPLEELDFEAYLEDVQAGYDALERSAVVVGHGLGGLLALKLAERREIDALVILSPAIPAPVRPVPPPHVVRLVPAVYQGELIDWAGTLEQIQRQNPDLSLDDVRRIQHLLGAESGAARRQMLAGVHVERDRLPDVPMLVVGAGPGPPVLGARQLPPGRLAGGRVPALRSAFPLRPGHGRARLRAGRRHDPLVPGAPPAVASRRVSEGPPFETRAQRPLPQAASCRPPPNWYRHAHPRRAEGRDGLRTLAASGLGRGWRFSAGRAAFV